MSSRSIETTSVSRSAPPSGRRGWMRWRVGTRMPSTSTYSDRKCAPGVFPAPVQALPRPSNNHLSYVITWYGLAASLFVIFIVYARKALRP